MADGAFSTPSKTSTERTPVAFAGASRRGFYRRYSKRFLDFSLVLILAPVVVPVLAVLALLIGRSPFYSQPRIGKDGRTFRMWKLRSMVRDADAALAACLARDPKLRREWDLNQKLDQDPRITRIGRLIRKTSFDELPQLWNVLRGDMSIVGPRPMMLDQKDLYPGKAYYRLRPGLTGPWQVSDRNAVSFRARAQFDEDYDRHLSFRGDCSLILKTIRVVLRATGK